LRPKPGAITRSSLRRHETAAPQRPIRHLNYVYERQLIDLPVNGEIRKTAITTATDAGGNAVTSLVSDPLAGLQKWVLVGGVWQLEYVLQAGLHLNEPVNVPGYPAPTFTTGLRNLTGRVNDDGTVTLYAVTAQTSTISGGEPDPTRLVAITDVLAATHLPTDSHGDGPGHVDFGHDGDDHFGSLETFVTLQTSRAGEVFRGVAFAPTP
jgi:hypothetical protein